MPSKAYAAPDTPRPADPPLDGWGPRWIGTIELTGQETHRARTASPETIARLDAAKAAHIKAVADAHAAQAERQRWLRTSEGQAAAAERHQQAQGELAAATAAYLPARQRWIDAQREAAEAAKEYRRSLTPLPMPIGERDYDLENARAAAAWDRAHPSAARHVEDERLAALVAEKLAAELAARGIERQAS